MREFSEAKYFEWLCGHILDRDEQTYKSLLEMLHSTEFMWVVPADRHRAEDGKELKLFFRRYAHIPYDPVWEDEPASVLEVLIAFAKRASFQTAAPVKDWFWELITNLGLEDFRRMSQEDYEIANEIIHTFMNRTYEPNGSGGLFPLNRSEKDQRKVEIWYQFAEYVQERGLI